MRCDMIQVDQEEESVSTDTPGIIIIHPGSNTLRIGLSTQLDPYSLPHVIAYRSINRPTTTSSTALSVLTQYHQSQPTVNTTLY